MDHENKGAMPQGTFDVTNPSRIGSVIWGAIGWLCSIGYQFGRFALYGAVIWVLAFVVFPLMANGAARIIGDFGARVVLSYESTYSDISFDRKVQRDIPRWSAPPKEQGI
jgi:hypothetical protein